MNLPPRFIKMKILSQFCIIALFSFLGELLHALVPFPIPAAIWGLVLLFLALLMGWIRPEHIKDTGSFLTLILPLLFIAPLVGIMKSAPLILENLIPILVILIVATFVTFIVSGGAAQLILRLGRRKVS